MIYRIYSALIVLAIIGCMAGCTDTAVKPQTTIEVKVPVPTKEKAPAELLACGHDAPGFTFKSPAPGSDDVLILKEDQPAFQAWINGKNVCIQAWQEWAQ